MLPQLKKLVLNPGVNTESTQTLNSGSWSASNLVRWFQGYLQKLGGWERLVDTLLSGESRGMHAYQTDVGNDYLLTGSEQSVQVYFDGALYTLDTFSVTHVLDSPGWLVTNGIVLDVLTINDPDAPSLDVGDLIHIDVTSTVNDQTVYAGSYTVNSGNGGSGPFFIDSPITSTGADFGGNPPYIGFGGAASGPSNRISVFLPGHGLSSGDTFVIQVTTVVAGVSLFGPYIVDVVSTDDFTIIIPSYVTFNDFAYELQDSSGDPLGHVSYNTTIPADVENWSFDNFGNVALMCYQGGPLLSWLPPVSNLAAVGVITAPIYNDGIFVAQPQAQVFSYGSEAAGTYDPLLLRWSDVGSYTSWIASAANQAGSFRFSRGSRIVGGIQAPQVSLFWTDIDLWSAGYVGAPFVYSFNIVQTGCGLIAQRARAVLYGQTYWMSQKQFFTYGPGGVAVLPCSVWDEVFNDLDEENVGKCWTWAAAGFNEIWFFFPSTSNGSGEPDKYVKYNVTSQLWDVGYLGRTAGVGQSVLGQPIAGDTNLRLQQHEVGYDADGEPMEDVYIESGFIDLGEGTDIIAIDQIIPDFKWFGDNGFITLRIVAKNYPAEAGIKYGPYTVNRNTRFISLRTRARQIAFRVEWGAASGFSARLGAIRYRSHPAGLRP